MKPLRIAILVIGTLLILPALGLLAGGGALAVGHAFARDDDGYFTASLAEMDSDTAAITAEDLDLTIDPGTPGWLVDTLDADVRLDVTSRAGAEIFVGIAPQRDLDRYLAGVAHDEVDEVDGNMARYRNRQGDLDAAPPGDEDFWAAAATGEGTVRLDWEAEAGRWAVAIMNADGSPGVDVDVDVGVREEIVLPLAISLLAAGSALVVIGVVLITGAAMAHEPSPPPAGAAPPAPASGEQPVSLSAELDPALSRWMWLVKWLLAIPHIVVLAFLWVAFAVLTAVAGFAILFTGRYPRSLFDFNVGVLRWQWRVSYYASSGGLGTDRYPPFSLSDDPSYPARLEVDYPERLSRWLVLVKWWLLAIPHYVIVGLLVGASIRWATTEGDRVVFDSAGGGGILGLLVVVAAVILLVTGRYPQALFDLIVGLNRWVYRVVAYASLMTDRYPPFRLDQGGSEPDVDPTPPSGPAPSGASAADEPIDRSEESDPDGATSSERDDELVGR